MTRFTHHPSLLRAAVLLGGVSFCLAAPLAAELLPYGGQSPPWIGKARVVVTALPPGIQGPECQTGIWAQIPAEVRAQVDLAGRTGLYSQTPAIVWLKGDWKAATFRHEWGHHVWYQVLTAAQRGEFADLWAAHKPELPSDYARGSVEEGWAECFKLYSGTHRGDLKPVFRTFLAALWQGWAA